MALSDAYANNAAPVEQRRQTSLAASFASDPKMEALEKLKCDDPAAFARLGTATRMSLGYWVQARHAHAAAEAAAEAAAAAHNDQTQGAHT
jgi:hypothetical protein